MVSVAAADVVAVADVLAADRFFALSNAFTVNVYDVLAVRAGTIYTVDVTVAASVPS